MRPAAAIVILDLVKHRFEEARELYADEWLGFSEAELETMLEKAGFAAVETSVVDKEAEGATVSNAAGRGREGELGRMD